MKNSMYFDALMKTNKMKDENIEFYYNQSQSIKSRLIKFVFKLSGLKSIMKHFGGSKTLVDLSSWPRPTKSVKKIAHVKHELINEKNVFFLSSKKTPSQTVVLYLHGGAFIVNFTRPHWNFIRALIEQTHCNIVAPDFSLLPDYDYKSRLDMVYKVYEKLLKTTNNKNIILMGDSSGGNMALALAQLLHESNMPSPAQVILLSPWLDVSMSNSALKINLPKDPMLSFEGAIKVGKAHAGNKDTTFYQVSPLYGKLKDIGKISLFTGTHDILFPDAKKLKKIAEEQSVPINYFEYKAMMHAWMLFDMQEAQLVKQQVASLINDPIAE